MSTNAARELATRDTNDALQRVRNQPPYKKRREIGRVEKRNLGSTLDDFLEASGLLKEATAAAVKRVIAWQSEQQAKGEAKT